jgi:hypothetical protein
MTRKDLDTLWQKALTESIRDGEQFTRYHFAQLVAAAEREACAKIADEVGDDDEDCHAWTAADAIRARGRE